MNNIEEAWRRDYGHRPRVTTLAAAAVAETAKEYPLTPDEVHRLKTRLQYRMYQRNHRAKRIYQQSHLQAHNRALEEEIAALTTRIKPLRRALMTTALDMYMQAFRSSLQREWATQEALIRSRFSPLPIGCAPVCGEVNKAVNQWRTLSRVCSEWQMEWDRFSASILQHNEEYLVVSVRLTLRLRGTWNTGDEKKCLPSQGLVVQGRGVLAITRDHLIAWYTMEFDILDSTACIVEPSLPVMIRIWIHQWSTHKKDDVQYELSSGSNEQQTSARPQVESDSIKSKEQQISTEQQVETMIQQQNHLVPSTDKRHSVNYLLS